MITMNILFSFPFIFYACILTILGFYCLDDFVSVCSLTYYKYSPCHVHSLMDHKSLSHSLPSDAHLHWVQFLIIKNNTL